MYEVTPWSARTWRGGWSGSASGSRSGWSSSPTPASPDNQSEVSIQTLDQSEASIVAHPVVLHAAQPHHGLEHGLAVHGHQLHRHHLPVSAHSHISQLAVSIVNNHGNNNTFLSSSHRKRSYVLDKSHIYFF